MGTAINSIYSNDINSYTNYADSNRAQAAESKTEKTGTVRESTKTESAAKKTAADELSYLSKKYSNYSFVGANYTKGMQYGSSSTVNVAISPQFLSKMANDPELEKEYEKNIAVMQECDEQNARAVAAGGWHVVAQGWAIDKDGGISKWSIVQKDDAESHLQKLSENAEKIKERNAEKKKQEEVEEKRQAQKEEKSKLQEEIEETCREQFGDKLHGIFIIDQEDESAAASKGPDKNHSGASGANLDMKI